MNIVSRHQCKKKPTCPYCNTNGYIRKHGKSRAKIQRYLCSYCSKTFQNTYIYNAHPGDKKNVHLDETPIQIFLLSTGLSANGHLGYGYDEEHQHEIEMIDIFSHAG